MKSKGRLSKHFQHKIKAGMLAFLTAFAALAGSVSPQMIVNAGSFDTLARVSTYGYTGSVQTYRAPADGTYILEVVGAPGMVTCRVFLLYCLTFICPNANISMIIYAHI